MEYVKLNGVYRSVLLTADLTTTPNEAAWPDTDIIASDISVSISGAPYLGNKTITKSVVVGETGKHTITLDCTGLAAGTIIELSGAYLIDSVRYYFATEIYVDAGSETDKIPRLPTSINGGADFTHTKVTDTDSTFIERFS